MNLPTPPLLSTSPPKSPTGAPPKSFAPPPSTPRTAASPRPSVSSRRRAISGDEGMSGTTDPNMLSPAMHPRFRARSRVPLIHVKTSSVTEGSSYLPPTPASINTLNRDLTLPILSPTASYGSPAQSPDYAYFPHQPKSLAGIAVRSLCLGAALAAGLIFALEILFFTTSALWRIPFFFTALAAHHFLEFWSTAAYNTRAAEVGSFLLTANWPSYAIAHATAALECLLVNLIWPNRSWAPFHSGPILVAVGLGLVVMGQVVRTVAMMQAGPSFNHMIQHQRSASHVLVTTGIYGKLRHPSYFGFFWWAIGTQLVLGNVICFFGYTMVLWRFFRTRVRHEEDVLIMFFGNEYVNYRNAVSVKIPLIP